MEESNTDRKRRTTTLAVDLKELKTPWLAWCKARRITPSEAVRQVLLATMTMESDEGMALSVKPARVVRGTRKRLAFSVTEAEHVRLTKLAGREGMSVPRWLQALVQVHLTGEGQLSDREMLAMLGSNRAILALGRNINQIARHLNTQPGTSPADLARIAMIQHVIEAHRVQVRRVLDANRERWRR